jgi:hypothetical protein
LRKPLTPTEIIELDQALIEAFSSHRNLKNRVPAARHIKFPQVPAVLAESLVIGAVSRLFGPGWKATFGGSLSDVRLDDATGQTRLVEVKSTGGNGFQELKAKDLSADTLVWVHYGGRFHQGSGAFRIVILDNPGKHISAPTRLDIPRLLHKVGDTPDLRELEIADLETFLSSST